jgi:hypothetical protein
MAGQQRHIRPMEIEPVARTHAASEKRTRLPAGGSPFRKSTEREGIDAAVRPLPIVVKAQSIIAPIKTMQVLPTMIAPVSAPTQTSTPVPIAVPPAPTVVSAPPPVIVTPVAPPTKAAAATGVTAGGGPSVAFDVPAGSGPIEATAVPFTVGGEGASGGTGFGLALGGGAVGFFAAGPVGGLVGAVLGFVASRAGSK